MLMVANLGRQNVSYSMLYARIGDSEDALNKR